MLGYSLTPQGTLQSMMHMGKILLLYWALMYNNTNTARIENLLQIINVLHFLIAHCHPLWIWMILYHILLAGFSVLIFGITCSQYFYLFFLFVFAVYPSSSLAIAVRVCIYLLFGVTYAVYPSSSPAMAVRVCRELLGVYNRCRSLSDLWHQTD